MEKEINIRPFLDEEGLIKAMPAKRATRHALLGYLAEKFDEGRDYTEKEVNALCDAWHTFNDYFLLRRELVEEGYLARTPNGARYWKQAQEG